MTKSSHEQRYLEIRAEAEKASGPLASLRVRAKGYLDIHRASNDVCRFALVASHGALWASWYLVCAKIAAAIFAVLDPTTQLSSLAKYRQFAAYVMTLKEINKLVMVETYVLVHTVQQLGSAFAATKGFPEDLAKDYEQAMARADHDADFLRELYHRHFLWEQERVVSSKLDEAFELFTWPIMRSLCERPWVWFSYFSVGKSMNFKSFTDQAERVEKGLIAYDRAVAFGVERLAMITEARLRVFPGIFVWKQWLKTVWPVPSHNIVK